MNIDNRPTSPHLDIYRWRITMLTSILHRATGAFVSLGLFILVIQLTLIATHGPDTFSPSGMITNTFWFIWTFAVYYHLSNGIRHLVWDTGKGFKVAVAEKSAKIVLISAAVLTLLTWAFV